MDKMLALGIVLSAKDMFSPVLSKLNGGIGDVLKKTDAMASKKVDLNQKLDKATLSAYGLDRQIKEIDDELKVLNAKKIKLDEQFKSGEISAEKFGAELSKVERKKSLLDSKKMRLSSDLDATTQSAKKLEAELNKIDKATRFEKIGKALKEIPKNATLAGTALIGVSVASRGAAETVIKSYVDFEDEQTQLKNTLMKSDGTVSPFFKSISNEATKLGNALPGTTADFFKMASTLKSLGVEEKSIVGGALKSAAYLGAVLKIPYEEAATATAKFKEAMGIADNELLPFIDDIQRLSHMGVQVGEMSFAFSKIGATMKGLGMSGLKAARDVEPLIGMLIKAGFSGETVGTNLGNIMKDAVSFKGSKDLDAMGIKLNFNDANGNFKGTENMIKQLEKLKAIKSDAARLSAVESIFGKGEASTMVNVLINKGTSGLVEFNKQMKVQADINQRAAESSKTLGSMWEAMTGTVTNLFALIGGSLSPEMKSLTEWFGNSAAAISSFGEKHPVITKFVGGAVVGLTIVTGVLGAVGIAVGALTFAVGALGITSMATFGIVLGAAALIGGAAFLIISNWEPIKGWFQGIFENIKTAASTSWEYLKGIFSWTPLGMVINNWTPIVSTFQAIIGAISKPFTVFFDWIESKFKAVSETVNSVGSFFGMSTGQAPTPRTVRIPANTTSTPASARTAVENRTDNIQQRIASVPTRSQSMNNNVTVNISNPSFANAAQAVATQKQIDEQVRKALAKQKNDKADRGYAS
ncbi:MAG: phage tail tape measure protein [Pseudomonadota bacterium]